MAGQIAALLVAISPQLIDNASLVRKDTLIVLTTTVITGFVATAVSTSQINKPLIGLFSLAVLYFMRPAAAVMIIFVAIIFFCVHSWTKKSYGIIIIGSAIIFMLWVMFKSWLFDMSDWYLGFNDVTVNRISANTSTASIIVNQYGGSSNHLVITFMLYIRSLLTPHAFYWIESINQANVLLSIEGILWSIFVVPFSVIAVYKYWSNSKFFVLLFCHTTIMQWIMSSPTVALATEPIRYRLPFLPLYFIMAGIGIDVYYRTPSQERKQYHQILIIAYLLILVINSLYIKINL